MQSLQALMRQRLAINAAPMLNQLKINLQQQQRRQFQTNSKSTLSHSFPQSTIPKPSRRQFSSTKPADKKNDNGAGNTKPTTPQTSEAGPVKRVPWSRVFLGSNFGSFYFKLPSQLMYTPYVVAPATAAAAYAFYQNFQVLQQQQNAAHSPFIDTAMTMFEQAPFYKDIVGLDPNTGQLNAVKVKKVYGALPPPSPDFVTSSDLKDDLTYDFEIYLVVGDNEIETKDRIIILRVMVQNYGHQFYDRFGIFHPFGVPTPDKNSYASHSVTSTISRLRSTIANFLPHGIVDPMLAIENTALAPASQVFDQSSSLPTHHIVHLEVSDVNAHTGYAIRFPQRASDPWAVYQSKTFHGYLESLPPDQKESILARLTSNPTQLDGIDTKHWLCDIEQLKGRIAEIEGLLNPRRVETEILQVHAPQKSKISRKSQSIQFESTANETTSTEYLENELAELTKVYRLRQNLNTIYNPDFAPATYSVPIDLEALRYLPNVGRAKALISEAIDLIQSVHDFNLRRIVGDLFLPQISFPIDVPPFAPGTGYQFKPNPDSLKFPLITSLQALAANEHYVSQPGATLQPISSSSRHSNHLIYNRLTDYYSKLQNHFLTNIAFREEQIKEKYRWLLPEGHPAAATDLDRRLSQFEFDHLKSEIEEVINSYNGKLGEGRDGEKIAMPVLPAKWSGSLNFTPAQREAYLGMMTTELERIPQWTMSAVNANIETATNAKAAYESAIGSGQFIPNDVKLTHAINFTLELEHLVSKFVADVAVSMLGADLTGQQRQMVAQLNQFELEQERRHKEIKQHMKQFGTDSQNSTQQDQNVQNEQIGKIGQNDQKAEKNTQDSPPSDPNPLKQYWLDERSRLISGQLVGGVATEQPRVPGLGKHHAADKVAALDLLATNLPPSTPSAYDPYFAYDNDDAVRLSSSITGVPFYNGHDVLPVNDATAHSTLVSRLNGLLVPTSTVNSPDLHTTLRPILGQQESWAHGKPRFWPLSTLPCAQWYPIFGSTPVEPVLHIMNDVRGSFGSVPDQMATDAVDLDFGGEKGNGKGENGAKRGAKKTTAKSKISLEHPHTVTSTQTLIKTHINAYIERRKREYPVHEDKLNQQIIQHAQNAQNSAQNAQNSAQNSQHLATPPRPYSERGYAFTPVPEGSGIDPLPRTSDSLAQKAFVRLVVEGSRQSLIRLPNTLQPPSTLIPTLAQKVSANILSQKSPEASVLLSEEELREYQKALPPAPRASQTLAQQHSAFSALRGAHLGPPTSTSTPASAPAQSQLQSQPQSQSQSQVQSSSNTSPNPNPNPNPGGKKPSLLSLFRHVSPTQTIFPPFPLESTTYLPINPQLAVEQIDLDAAETAIRKALFCLAREHLPTHLRSELSPLDTPSITDAWKTANELLYTRAPPKAQGPKTGKRGQREEALHENSQAGTIQTWFYFLPQLLRYSAMGIRSNHVAGSFMSREQQAEFEERQKRLVGEDYLPKPIHQNEQTSILLEHLDNPLFRNIFDPLCAANLDPRLLHRFVLFTHEQFAVCYDGTIWYKDLYPVGHVLNHPGRLFSGTPDQKLAASLGISQQALLQAGPTGINPLEFNQSLVQKSKVGEGQQQQQQQQQEQQQQPGLSTISKLYVTNDSRETTNYYNATTLRSTNSGGFFASIPGLRTVASLSPLFVLFVGLTFVPAHAMVKTAMNLPQVYNRIGVAKPLYWNPIKFFFQKQTGLKPTNITNHSLSQYTRILSVRMSEARSPLTETYLKMLQKTNSGFFDQMPKQSEFVHTRGNKSWMDFYVKFDRTRKTWVVDKVELRVDNCPTKSIEFGFPTDVSRFQVCNIEHYGWHDVQNAVYGISRNTAMAGRQQAHSGQTNISTVQAEFAERTAQSVGLRGVKPNLTNKVSTAEVQDDKVQKQGAYVAALMALATIGAQQNQQQGGLSSDQVQECHSQQYDV